VIEAVRWDGTNYKELETFGAACGAQGSPDGPQIMIATLEGTMTASPGDWIIKGVKGEFYPWKPDIFAATYERFDG
jgi:hypothetical protein